MSYLLADSIENLAQLSADELVSQMLSKEGDHSKQEQQSWRASLFRLIQLIAKSGLGNLWLISEYSLIGDQRIDAVLCGYNTSRQPQLVLVESKQWDGIGPNTENKFTSVKMNFADEYRPHPVAQVFGYKHQLMKNHSAVREDNMRLDTVVFMHNFPESEVDALFAGNYVQMLPQKRTVFVRGEEPRLQKQLQNLFNRQAGAPVANRFLAGNYQLGQADLTGFKKVLKREDNAVMLEDQIEVSTRFSAMLTNFINHPANTAMIISGAAGTGKTIVGLHLLYLALARQGLRVNQVVFSLAKSKTIHDVLEADSGVLPYLDKLPSGEYRLIVVDEAHRMTDPLQVVGKFFDACATQQQKTFLVFLQDDHQRVRLNETGTVSNMVKAFGSMGVTPAVVALNTQKRAEFQGTYVAELRQLFFGEDDDARGADKAFPLVVSDSLKWIDRQLSEKQTKDGKIAKWFAPYDWPWQSQNNLAKMDIRLPDPPGQDFVKQWNPFKNQATWVKSNTEAALNQVGSVYTAQGLDYDYSGFIWDKSLRWNPESERWEFSPSLNQDKGFTRDIAAFPSEEVLQVVLNQFYVLLSRARMGSYIWFQDDPTKKHFLAIMRGVSIQKQNEEE